jgi:hypothetical protein
MPLCRRNSGRGWRRVCSCLHEVERSLTVSTIIHFLRNTAIFTLPMFIGGEGFGREMQRTERQY